MLEVHRRQASTRTPAGVLTDYERSRFSKPSRAAFGQLARFEQVMLDYLPEQFQVVTRSSLCPLRNRGAAVSEIVLEPLRAQFEDVVFQTDPTRATGRGYYSGLAFQIRGQYENQTLFLVDGGEVNWSQKLLSNAKERMVISGLGSERLCTMVSSRQRCAIRSLLESQ